MRILVADDDPINRVLLQRFLANWNYEVDLAANGAEAWEILKREDAPKLAILDWMMPGMDGPEICREVRNLNNRSYVYILLLTGNNEKGDIIAGLDSGADDYLTKPFDANELKARLRAGRRILELQEQLLSTNGELKFQAEHDSLTGMWSRAKVLETMRTELGRAHREGTAVGIILADLDHFKGINDTYGHMAGDAVLRETAKRMRSSVRPYDTIGRYGGEEFLIVVPGCDQSNAVKRAEQLRLAVGTEPANTSEGMISVTLSLGVTVSGVPMLHEAERLVRAADVALYEAKSGGRNQVRASLGEQAGFTESLQTSAVEKAVVLL